MSHSTVLMNDAPVPSPCIGICRLDALALCVGCRRSGREIAEWPHAGAARQREILRELTRRPVFPPGRR